MCVPSAYQYLSQSRNGHHQGHRMAMAGQFQPNPEKEIQGNNLQ